MTGDAPQIRVGRAVVTTSLSQGVVLMLTFATSIIQAGLLGADGRGDYARFANAAALLVLYLGFGVSSTITYFIASGAARPRELFRSIAPLFALSVVAVLACAVLAVVSPLRRFLPQTLAPEWVVVTLAAYFALTQAGTWLGAVLAARGRFGMLNVSSVAVSAAGVALSVVLLAGGPNWAVASVVIGLVIGLEALRVALLLVGLRDPGTPVSDGVVSGRAKVLTRDLVRYSALAFVADALQFLIYRVDMWIVDATHGSAELGRYALAVSLAQLVWIVPTATARILFPYAAATRSGDAWRLAWRAAWYSLLASAALGIGGWAASELFLPSMFGADFQDVPTLIGILLLGVVPFSTAKVLGNFLSGRNAIGSNALSTVIILVVALALDVVLIPPMGAIGAAWATAIAYGLHTLLLSSIFVFRRRAEFRAMRSAPNF